MLGALRDRLVQPGMVATFVEGYRREREADRAAAAARRKGGWPRLLADRAELHRNAEAEPTAAKHPNTAETYRQNVAKIAEMLNASEMETRERTPGAAHPDRADHGGAAR